VPYTQNSLGTLEKLQALSDDLRLEIAGLKQNRERVGGQKEGVVRGERNGISPTTGVWELEVFVFHVDFL